jgi:hypothetical protein
VTDRIHELLYRNLQEAFGEGDRTRRRAAIEDLLMEPEQRIPPVLTVSGSLGRCGRN